MREKLDNLWTGSIPPFKKVESIDWNDCDIKSENECKNSWKLLIGTKIINLLFDTLQSVQSIVNYSVHFMLHNEFVHTKIFKIFIDKRACRIWNCLVHLHAAGAWPFTTNFALRSLVNGRNLLIDCIKIVISKVLFSLNNIWSWNSCWWAISQNTFAHIISQTSGDLTC